MKKSILSIVLLCASIWGVAQDDQVLMTIAGKPVMVSEFMYIYEKNTQDVNQEKQSMEEYLDLFINFKLKVAEAEAQGVDTTEAFKKELNGYRAQAVPKYLQDHAAIDSLVALSYARMAKPRRAAHIVVQCFQDADSATTASALSRIEAARARVLSGEDFGDVSAEVSEEPSAKRNRGELGWIQPFRYIYEFEDVVYNTPVGEVSEVFRSPYGFHIAKVLEEGVYEEVHAAHIMKMVPMGNVERMAMAQMEMDSLYKLAQLEGSDFSSLAMANSEDKGSSVRGGDLGWFGRGAMVRPFEDVAFSMEVGSVSAPFASQYGIHIVKLYGKRGIQPLDSMRSQVLRQVQRDQRMQIAYQSFIDKTRMEYGLPIEMSNEDVYAYADAHLEEKYVDLRNLIKEYHDGILLFDVSLREVWDKANQDVEGLENYFEKHKKMYKWEEPRFKGCVIYAKNEVAAKSAKQIIKTAHPDSVMSYLNQRVNVDSVLYVRVERGLWKRGASAAVDKYGFKSKTAEYEPSEEFPIVIAMGKVIKSPQVYTDERGKVTTDYQDYLEKQWVQQLRTKYEVQINNEVWLNLLSQVAQ
jgi:peptidyl-prolyl cis-trans isomerase SurA